MTALPPLANIFDDYDLLESEDRYRLLIELGRKLEPMPDALKTDATKVRGCSASVWVYPTTTPDGRLHFLADSNAAITRGVVALVLTAVQDEAVRIATAIDDGEYRSFCLAMLARLYEIAIGSFQPDLTLILDLPIDTGLARAAGRRGNGSPGRHHRAP